MKNQLDVTCYFISLIMPFDVLVFTSHQHTPLHTVKGTLIAKTSVFTEKDDRFGNSSTQSRAPEDGYIKVRNMLSA